MNTQYFSAKVNLPDGTTDIRKKTTHQYTHAVVAHWRDGLRCKDGTVFYYRAWFYASSEKLAISRRNTTAAQHLQAQREYPDPNYAYPDEFIVLPVELTPLTKKAK